MRTVFALFDNFTDAEAAVLTLTGQGFDVNDINVIVQSQSAKTEMENVNWDKVKVQKTEAVGQRTAQGLERLIGGEQPVPVPGVGDVFAANELATQLARTAAAPGAADQGLHSALQELGLPQRVAETYTAGLRKGWLLLFVRAADERAMRAAQILRDHQGREVNFEPDYPVGPA